MSDDIEILTESELVTLETSPGDDCCVAAVRCVTSELRTLRAEVTRLKAELAEAKEMIERQSRRITILVMDQRRQLPEDVLRDIADSHTERDWAKADRDAALKRCEELTRLHNEQLPKSEWVSELYKLQDQLTAATARAEKAEAELLSAGERAANVITKAHLDVEEANARAEQAERERGEAVEAHESAENLVRHYRDLYDALGESLERIVGGNHSSLERLAKLQHRATLAESELARWQPVIDIAQRWCKRPVSCLAVGSTVLANDAEMFAKLHAAIDALTNSEDK